MNRFYLLLALIANFVIGCEDYVRHNIGILSDLSSTPQLFDVHLSRKQQRWWILLYAQNDFNLSSDNIEVVIHNKSKNRLTATYGNTTHKTLDPNAKVSMFYGSFGQLLAQSSGMAGLSCQSESGNLDFTIEFHHRDGLKLNGNIRIIAHTQNVLP